MMARTALAATASAEDQKYSDAQITLARYFAEHELPRVGAGKQIVIEGGESTIALDIEML